MKKIKEIKIVNQDGSTELANVGADAVNVDYNNTTVKAELDKLNVTDNSLLNTQTNQETKLVNLQSQIAELANQNPQLPEIVDARMGFDTLGEIIQKKTYFFDSVAEMKACEHLKAGDCVQTLGYYSANDGGGGIYQIVNDSSLEDDGGSVHDLVNGFKATLIIDTPEFNVLKYGSITSDNIIKAINYVYDNFGGGLIKVPKINETIVLNKYINVKNNCTLDLGMNTYIIDENFSNKNQSCIGLNTENGETWVVPYNAKGITIRNGDITNNSNSTNCIKNLSSMSKIENMIFRGFNTSILKDTYYTDLCEINRCTFNPTVENSQTYQIRIEGSGDGLKISQCHFGNGNTIQSAYNVCGIYLDNVDGGKITDCINGDITIKNSMALSIENFHGELSAISFSNCAGCSINDSMLWNYHNRKKVLDLENNLPSAISINNVVLHEIPAKIPIEENLDMAINTSNISINNLTKRINIKDVDEKTLLGLKIGSNDEINKELTFKSNLNYNNSEIDNKKYQNEFNCDFTDSSKTFDIESFADGDSDWQDTKNQRFTYNSIALLDIERMLFTGAHGNKAYNVTKKSAILCVDIEPKTTLRLYRGVKENLYHKYVDIPIIKGNYIEDFGSNINGFFWKMREESYIDNGTRCSKVKFVGKNVIAWCTVLPTTGSWKKNDIIINTNPTSGNDTAWICTGSGSPGTWASLGKIN